MGRQRRRKQRSDLQGPRVDSFLYDEAGLLILAYLERTIIYSMRLEFFGPDVIFHYKEQLQRDISVAEIDAKLCLFWSHWHSVDDKPVEWRKIYKLGLKGLPLLEDEWKEWVRKKAAMLKDVTEGTPRRLRSRSALPRSLRNPAKRPLSSPIGDPSGSQVQNIQNHSESPAQRKRTRMSISAVSHQLHFLIVTFLTSQLQAECSKNPKFPDFRTRFIKTKAPRGHKAALR